MRGFVFLSIVNEIFMPKFRRIYRTKEYNRTRSNNDPSMSTIHGKPRLKLLIIS